MKKTKEGVNLKKKKFLRLKNTGGILVIMGLMIIFIIALYTFILQSSYTKTALETEIARDTASADAVHKLVDGKIGKEDFAQIKDQSDEKKQLYKDISSYFNEIRTLNSTRYIYTNAIQLSIISVVFCHREPLFFMPKNFKNITKNS